MIIRSIWKLGVCPMNELVIDGKILAEAIRDAKLNITKSYWTDIERVKLVSVSLHFFDEQSESTATLRMSVGEYDPEEHED